MKSGRQQIHLIIEEKMLIKSRRLERAMGFEPTPSFAQS